MPKRKFPPQSGTLDRYAKRAKTATKAKRQARPRATGAFAKRVRTVLHKEAETKLKVVTFLDKQVCPRSGLKTNDTTNQSVNGISIINLWGQSVDHPGTYFFKMERGTEQGQFIGNQISNAVMNFRGFVVTRPYDTDNSSVMPYEFHILIYRNKLTPANGNPNGILTKPDNDVGEITGDAKDTMYAWNRDGYIIKKHMMMRMRPRMKTLSTDSSQNAQLSNAPVFRRFGFQIKLPKVIHIPDSESFAQSPSANYQLGFYVVNGDGEQLEGTQTRCEVSLVGALRFKDY